MFWRAENHFDQPELQACAVGKRFGRLFDIGLYGGNWHFLNQLHVNIFFVLFSVLCSLHGRRTKGGGGGRRRKGQDERVNDVQYSHHSELMRSTTKVVFKKLYNFKAEINFLFEHPKLRERNCYRILQFLSNISQKNKGKKTYKESVNCQEYARIMSWHQHE